MPPIREKLPDFIIIAICACALEHRNMAGISESETMEKECFQQYLWISVSIQKGPTLLKSSIMKYSSDETLGDLISRAEETLGSEQSVTVSRIIGRKGADQSDSVELNSDMPMTVLKTYSLQYLVVYVKEEPVPKNDEASHSPDADGQSALDLLMKMQRNYCHYPQQRLK